MKASLVVSAAILRHGCLLLVQEGKEYCRGQWGLPGGRVEEGEGIAEAVVREVREETGLDVRVTGMTPVVRYISQYGFHCVRFNFIAEADPGDLRVDGGEIIAARWFSPENLDALGDAELRTAPMARRIFADIRAGRIFPHDIVFDALGSGADVDAG